MGVPIAVATRQAATSEMTRQKRSETNARPAPRPAGAGRSRGQSDPRPPRLRPSQLVPAGGLTGSEAPPIVHEVLREPGAPLDAGTRKVMEERLGADLGHVRVHAGDRAAASAGAVNADAFTAGSSIVFGPGRYAPHREEGRRLLAHELVHTLQQHRAGKLVSGQRLTIGSPESEAENKARAVAGASPASAIRPAAVLRPSTVPVAVPRPATVASPMVVARQPQSASQQAQQASQQAQQASQQAQSASQQAQSASQQAQSASQQAQQASGQAGDAMARANAAMDEAMLASLRTVAAGHLGFAYTDYVSACRDVRDSIKAAAKQNAEMMALVLDVAMGFVTPGLSRWIVGFANRIPVQSSTAAYRVALAALDGDRVKAVLTTMTKGASQSLKSHSLALAGETDLDKFVGTLQTHTHEAFQMIIDSLPTMNAVEVGVVTAAFDSSVANHDVYVQDILRLTDMYQREVSPIGEVPFMSEAMPSEAVWVKDGASQRLAIVTYHPGLLGIWGNAYWLDSWVDPEMASLVVDKQYAKFGRLDTIGKDQLRGIH